MPAFTASVPVPPSLVVSAPAVTAGLADFVVRIGEPLPIAFSGGGGADVEILLSQTAVSTLPGARPRLCVGRVPPRLVREVMARRFAVGVSPARYDHSAETVSV